MANYLYSHYKGEFRIVPNLDTDTNDVPRNEDNTIADGYDDTYIECASHDQIYYFGGSILEAYITSLIRGRRILKELADNHIPVIPNIEGDSEVIFRFEATYIYDIAKRMHARTLGADISPFSPRRLPKATYKIAEDSQEWKDYKHITAMLPKSKSLYISTIIKDFIRDELTQYIDKAINVRLDMRQKKMARLPKEYIHSLGLWQQFLSYLENRINAKLILLQQNLPVQANV